MPLPPDLIFVRHGQSEGNVANKASRKGDHSLFTPEFRNRHSRNFRLTEKGIRQAKAAGDWLKANVKFIIDRFYVSDYIRAKETAAHLSLPNAQWRVEDILRERDHALMDNCPDDEKKRFFQREEEQYQIDPYLSYPAGGGESMASMPNRLNWFVEHLCRQYSSSVVITVCHGHVMRPLQMKFERLTHDDFIRLDKSDDPKDDIRNCQILWYTRRNITTGQIESDHLTAVRSVCPWDPDGDSGWRPIVRRKYSNQDLMEEVQRYPRMVNCK